MKVFAEYDKTRNSVSASNIEEKKCRRRLCRAYEWEYRSSDYYCVSPAYTVRSVPHNICCYAAVAATKEMKHVYGNPTREEEKAKSNSDKTARNRK